MKSILVYDDIADKLEAIASQSNVTITEIIDALLENGQEIIEDLYLDE